MICTHIKTEYIVACDRCGCSPLAGKSETPLLAQEYAKKQGFVITEWLLNGKYLCARQTAFCSKCVNELSRISG